MLTTEAHPSSEFTRGPCTVRIYMRGVCVGRWRPDTMEEAEAIFAHVKEEVMDPVCDMVQLVEARESKPFKREGYEYMVKEIWQFTITAVRHGDEWLEINSKYFLPPNIKDLKEVPY